MQHKCNDILKKHNYPILTIIFILFIRRARQ